MSEQKRTRREPSSDERPRQQRNRNNSNKSNRNIRNRSRRTSGKSRRYRQAQLHRRIAATVAGVFFLLLLIFIIRGCSGCNKEVSSKNAAASASGSTSKDLVEMEAVTSRPVSLTLSVVGDCTLGTDENFDYDSSLNAYYESYGPSYFLQNVKSIFSSDDLTIANFEGTLTDLDTREDKTFAFKAPASYASILTEGSVEAVNTANNHSHDYGEQSFDDTLKALDAQGIVHFGYDETAIMDIKGVKVGLVGIYELDDHLGREEQLKKNIAKVKANCCYFPLGK